MFRWATKVWKTISEHEKQSLLRNAKIGHSRPKAYAFDHLCNGRKLDLSQLKPAQLSKVEELQLNMWTQELSTKWKNESVIKKYITSEGMYGLEIPREYEGLGFSPYFHSRFLRRLVCLDRDGNYLHRIMVPNSLGPAQLLLSYGTDQQKQKYLPNLPSGKQIPCFALTGPWNGSDAGNIQDIGTLETDEHGTVGIRFSCEKRWCTLAPVADLISVAIRVRKKGITLLLLDRHEIICQFPGQVIIEKHQPIGSQFPNGRISIDNIWVPLETSVIGGRNGLGKGWNMLMSCLHQGRGISLPSVSHGGNAYLLWHSLFYSMSRKQFDQVLLDIFGVKRVVADSIAVWFSSHILNEFYHAILKETPPDRQSSAFSAFMKWSMTELHRDMVLNTMDIYGGKGISLGPQNPVAHFYLQNPIGNTVEGANILTEHVIVPIQTLFEHLDYFQEIMVALEKEDPSLFYQQVTRMVAHFLQHGVLQTIWDRKASRVVLLQYYCMLQGQKLRNKQHLTSMLCRYLAVLIHQTALEWWKIHYTSHQFHSFARIIAYDFEQRMINKKRRFLEPRQVDILVDDFLHEPQYLQWLETDLIIDSQNNPLYQVSQLWKSSHPLQRHSNGYTWFYDTNVPMNLREKVISVDSWPLPDQNIQRSN